MVCIHEDKCGDFLARRLRLNRDLMSESPAEGPSEQVIGASWLYGTDLRDEIRRHLAERAGEFTHPAQGACLQSVHRDVLWNVSGQ